MDISKASLKVAVETGALTAAFIFASLPVRLGGAAPAKAPTTPLPSTARAFIESNCTACHRPSNPPAGIQLTSLAFSLDDVDTFGRWVRVHDAVQVGKMPPGAKNLSAADRKLSLPRSPSQ